MNSYIEPIWTFKDNIRIHMHVKITHGSSAIPNGSQEKQKNYANL